MNQNNTLGSYIPADIETKWQSFWTDNQTYALDCSPVEADFSIALPPPNVTGQLHMGHALNGTIQDILIRYNRMCGKKVHWQIGCDHAGIGTQIVVEKNLAKQNISKHEIGREKFLEEAWKWTNQHKGHIEQQMKLLGFSPDYSQSAFTLDDNYIEWVQHSFFELFKKGLIYQGKRLINWCPKCLTSLSDLEVEHKDSKAKLWNIIYKLNNIPQNIDIKQLIIATSRPETLFGDVAVAINPKDPQYIDIIELIQAGNNITANIPIINKPIPVILSNSVEIGFGTGALKVTPAHDFNDNDIIKEYNLRASQNIEAINIFDKEAKILDLDFIPAEFHGLTRYKARDVLINQLETADLLTGTEDYTQSSALHDRCNTVIEPYLSEQWFVSMPKLADIAIQALESKQVQFYPERYSKTYLDWLNNIQDWCISRQLWWGHSIPVWTKAYSNLDNIEASHKELVQEFRQVLIKLNYLTDLKSDIHAPTFVIGHKSNSKFILQATDKEVQIVLSNDSSKESQEFIECITKLGYKRDPDVLDTWFSSALWPFATQTSINTQVQKPWTNVLSTAREIINLWISRMIYSSLNLTNNLPFTDILIHPVIQTPDGKRMSKSKGNAIDPVDLVNKYGADANRLWYASIGIFAHQDTRFPGQQNKKSKEWTSNILEQNKRFINKLWNAVKFVKYQTTDIPEYTETIKSPYNKWIFTQCQQTIYQAEEYLKDYKFAEYATVLQDFIWDEYCDWYLEIAKLNIQANSHIQETQYILYTILEQIIRALYPVIPFVCEELWNYLTNQTEAISLTSQRFPSIQATDITPDTSSKIMILKELISAIRSVKKNLLGLADSAKLNINLLSSTGAELSLDKLKQTFGENLQLLNLAHSTYTETLTGQTLKYSNMSFLQVTIEIPESVNITERISTIEQSCNKYQQELDKITNLLNNEGFVKNASSSKIEQCHIEQQALEQKLIELKEAIKQFVE